MTENQAKPQEAGWNFDNSYARLPEIVLCRAEPGAGALAEDRHLE